MSPRATAAFLALALGALTGLGILLLRGESPQRDATSVVAPSLVESHGDEPAGPEVVSPAERLELGDSKKPTGPRLRGRLVDVGGKPVGGVTVAGGGAEDKARSRTDGRFVLHGVERPAAIEPQSKEFVSVTRTVVEGGADGPEHWLVVAPPIDLVGTVVDRSGAPVLAEVRAVYAPELVDVGFGPILTAPLAHAVQASPSGSFALERVPAVAGARLVVARAGYRIHSVELPSRSKRNLRIELEPRSVTKANLGRTLVHGLVVDDAGEPVPDAKILLGDVETLADVEGRFALLAGIAVHEPPLVVLLPGRAPTVLEDYGGRVLRAMQDGLELPPERIVLAPAASAIDGVLVGVDDRPLTGWQVDLVGGSYLGVDPSSFTAEELSAGRSHEARVGGDGRFRFDGLRPGKTYRVFAWQGKTLRAYTSAPIVAPTAEDEAVELRLQIPEASSRGNVEGTLRSRDGTPLADIDVRLSLVIATHGEHRSWLDGRRTRTDAEGKFTFHDVAHGELWLRCSGAPVVDGDFRLAPENSGRGLELSLARRLRFRFVGDDGTYDPDGIAVVDGAGEILSISTQLDGRGGGRIGLRGGKSPVLFVSEDADQVVIFRGGDEIDRIDLRLVAGEVTTVRR